MCPIISSAKMTSRCFLSPTCCGFATNFTFILRIVGGNKIEIGVASAKSLTRVSFSSIYEGWSAKNVYVDLDAALVQVEDVNAWTTQIYGVGAIGKLADLDTNNCRCVSSDVRSTPSVPPRK
jgi:hypothetical protein